MTTKQKVAALLERLNDGVFEKEHVMALSLLTAIAGESIFLLGAPGVAKSLVARKLKFAFKEGSSFEYLMNRFSTPDEIFGPVSISKLKDQDKYERIVKNYLPDATVVFLDEIWKAGPSIQNALLTVLNERIYRNGEQEIKVPMKALISASNELPSKGEGLEALWDRFLVRLIVEGVKDKQNFNDMISKSLNSYNNTVSKELQIAEEEYTLWSQQIDKIEISENIFNVIHVIRSYLEIHNGQDENNGKQIYVSDRRWRKVIRLLRTSAFLNDRQAVDLMDCFLIINCLWNESGQIIAVRQFVTDAIQKHGYSLTINLKDIQEELKEFNDEVLSETSFLKEVNVSELKLVEGKFYQILNFQNKKMRIDSKVYDALDKRLEQNIFLYAHSSHFDEGRYHESGRYRVKKGRRLTVVIDGDEYPLETAIKTEKKKATKKPHTAVQREWDRQVKVFLTTTNNLKIQIEHYRGSDLKHLRINLFVDSVLANIVESNLIDLENEIGKLEVEIHRIKHFYENVEDQAESTEAKQIESAKDK